jgi:hypothetical protein
MDIASFKASVEHDAPPADVGPGLQALWHDAKGNWDTAHALSQKAPDPQGAWVHAYLHRVEGDESNAGHWYSRAGKPHCETELAQEWEEIACALLA